MPLCNDGQYYVMNDATKSDWLYKFGIPLSLAHHYLCPTHLSFVIHFYTGMKLKVLFFHALFCANTAWANIAPAPLVASTVTEVTVFKNGAQVNREAQHRLTPGRNELTFNALSPFIQEQSIQVRATGSLIILSVAYKVNYLAELEKQAEVKRLETQIEPLTLQLARLATELDLLKQEENLLQKNQVQVVGIPNSPLKTSDLQELAAYQKQSLRTIATRRFEMEQDIKLQNKALDALRKQIAQANGASGHPSGEITLVVNATSAGDCGFELDYFVPQASWVSAYDLRVKDISSPVALSQKATLFQQTGEDWNNIQLRLSTGNPTQNSTRPVLTPWLLRFVSPVARMAASSNLGGRFQRLGSGAYGEVRGQVIDAETGEALIGATVTALGYGKGAATDAEGNFSFMLPPGATQLSVSYTGYGTLNIPVQADGGIYKALLSTSNQMLEEVVVVGYAGKKDKKKAEKAEDLDYEEKEPPVTVVELPTTLLYEIEIPVTVHSNGQSQTVEIKNYDLPASYRYFCAPKLDRAAFLTAEVTQWGTLGLLSGIANLFFEGTYLGKTYLEFANINDTLPISLGRDENIVVTRTKVKDFSKRLLLGKEKVDSRTFEIAAKNKKQQSINLVIEDQVPISTSKNIKIDVKNTDDAGLDQETGQLTWTIELKSGQEMKKRFGYEVKYPRSRILVLE